MCYASVSKDDGRGSPRSPGLSFYMVPSTLANPGHPVRLEAYADQ